MNENIKTLNKTKKDLAIVFAGVVFFITFFLELTYLSFRYYSIEKEEKREFDRMLKTFDLWIKNWVNIVDFLVNDPRFFDIRQSWRWWKKDDDFWPLRFIDFLVYDKNWEVISWKLRSEINIDEINIESFDYSWMVQKKWVIFSKVLVNSWDAKDIVFVKKQLYPIEEFFEDLLYFNLINLLFSIWFYFVWLLFVWKILKPVEENIKSMDEFVHNASHELKTPLSVISSNLQIVNSLKSYEEDLITNSLDEIKRTDSLIVWLTNLSTISSTERIEEIKLNDEIREIVKEFENILLEKSIKLEIKESKQVKIKANKEYFYIMFSNLLRNAIRYNLDNDWIIKIEINKDKFSIENTWIWIWKDDLPKIFERLYKWEKARNSEWFWIWLSLVKKICETYSWKIKVTSEIDKETKFEVSFR